MHGVDSYEGSLKNPNSATAVTVDNTSRVPLPTQISRQITWQVVTGRIAPGTPLPVIAVLAKQLGINVHTVRAAYRQLADDGIVSMGRGARTRVLGYDRRRALGSNDSHPSFTIGVMVSAFNVYSNEILETLTTAAELEGWLPVFCRTKHYAPDVVSRGIDQLFSRNVDGLILLHFERFRDEEVIEILASSAKLRPFVLVDSTDIGAGSRILVDHAASAHVMTTHLIEHGHARIGHLGGPVDQSSTLPFRSGYDKALAGAGLAGEDRLIVPAADYSLRAGYRAAVRLLQQDDCPTAIMCNTDISALGVIAVAREMGIRIPEDLAVTGYGDMPLSRFAATPLSSVRISADELGREAVRTLRTAIDEGNSQPPVVVPTALVARESCGCTTR